MKPFRKNEDDKFVCEECKKLFKNIKGLQIHIRHSHESKYKDYYDKWIKEYGDDICKNPKCDNKTKFFSLTKGGYKHTCCNHCKNKYRQKQIEESNLKIYGVKNVWELSNTVLKIKQTKKKRYGNEKYRNEEKIKQTKKERYNNINYNNSEKRHKTNKEKYGVENPLQNKEIHEKSLKSGLLIKQYKKTNILYQGNNEYEFLEKYYNKFKKDLQRGPTISYIHKENKHVYFPDFLLKSKNLIIEIKSTYWYNKHKEICNIKKETCLNQGYNYIMILDKEYNEFDKYLLISC